MTTLKREQLPADATLVRSGALWALVLSGAATLETAGDRRTILPGDAVLVDPRTAYRLTADVDTDLVHGDLRREAPAAPWPNPLVMRGFGDEHRGVVALVTTCQLSVRCRSDRFAAAYASLIGAAISVMSRPAETVGGQVDGARVPADPQVAEVVAALAASPGERWTLDRMAALVHLSRSALTERFRRATGHSPMRMLREVRMHRARTLLTEQCLAVTRVAFEVGYGSVAAFSRAFAADHGVSPLAWRTAPATAGPGAVAPDPAVLAPGVPGASAPFTRTASGAGYPQERPAEPRRHRRPRADQQQWPDAVPVQ
ncbi:AraC family transcriptional regulator [Promicromonospora iranensis]|uniref:AraC family transcriptional regulator n=1 Tax=Promicromonospora iranensis TaxID=1105144 RepID=UPI0023A92FCF|nr:AraC family transcriptional regulator [Promicromonospora iranensis]